MSLAFRGTQTKGTMSHHYPFIRMAKVKSGENATR